ncbi:hypothetical protein niasHT_037225 [Heterodera trifolii]|uniref:Uncharacterized protein n=1 Tax=Heterodera trifolii TaxID=157864 RepID=A0ABD2IA42_9BILA
MLSTSTFCHLSSDQSIHLTSGDGGFKEIQIHTLAQCHANNGPKENVYKPYGIEFRLTRQGGNCEDGILICYPALFQKGSNLDTNSNSKISRKFIIDNKMGNSLENECAQKMPKNSDKNGTIIWRGLKLRTVPMPTYQNNGSIIILEASIASLKRYNLHALQRKFHVSFDWNQTALPFTRFSLEENDFDGRAMQNDFLRSNGPSFLADYADFWLLGLDMLPMAHKKELKMKLFINRSSNCSMEAWFIQPILPSDLKIQFKYWACKQYPKEDEFEWLFPKNVDKYVFPTNGQCYSIGNQMFRFATLYAIGKAYGRKPIYKDSHKCTFYDNRIEEHLFPVVASQIKYFNPDGKQNETFCIANAVTGCSSYADPNKLVPFYFFGVPFLS